MEKLIVDESAFRLVNGLLLTMQVMVLSLQAPGGFTENVLAALIEKRLEGFPENALESFPLAMMLKFLRPDEPPRPVLQLIQGGKS